MKKSKYLSIILEVKKETKEFLKELNELLNNEDNFITCYRENEDYLQDIINPCKKLARVKRKSHFLSEELVKLRKSRM